MGRPPLIPDENVWINQIFQAQAANGGVVRRSVADVEQYGGGVDNLKRFAKDQGYHLIRTGDQYVVLCHEGDLTVVC